MSKQGTILLAVGTLLVGLIVGFAAGGVSSRFLVGRAFVRSAAVGRSAPGYFSAPGGMPSYGGRGLPSFGQRPMPYYRGRGVPSFGQRPTPYYRGRGFQSRRAPGAAFANGARVVTVESNGPADKAGLKAGDVITAVAGTTIDPSHTLASLLQSHKVGDAVDLAVNRAGQSMTISVTLGAFPQNSSTPYLGIRYGPVFVRARNAI